MREPPLKWIVPAGETVTELTALCKAIAFQCKLQAVAFIFAQHRNGVFGIGKIVICELDNHHPPTGNQRGMDDLGRDIRLNPNHFKRR